MKNATQILTYVLVIAVGLLYYMLFLGNLRQPEEPVTEQRLAIDSIGSNLTVAYINYDTLMEKYKYVEDLNNEVLEKKAELDARFESRSKQLEKELRKRAEKFQIEVREFENKSAEMPEFTAKQTMMNLQNEETKIRESQYQGQLELEDLQDEFTQEIMDLQLKNSDLLQEAIHGYINKYNAKQNLSLIFAMSDGSNLMHAQNSLNITNDIVDGLNKEYEEKFKDKSKE